jgi:hypothetical protein
MIQSAGRKIQYQGGEAYLFVQRNNGYCWGRIVLPDDTNLDVDGSEDYYDCDDEGALNAFEAEAQEGGLSHGVGWEMTWAEAVAECDGSDEGAAEHGCEICPECGFHNDHSLSCVSAQGENEEG